MKGSKVLTIIFEHGKDPGEGYLRIVGDLLKVVRINDNHSRNISFKEIYEVMFEGGRSTLLEEFYEPKKLDGKEVQERQFKIIGLTFSGRPIIVVFTPRGFAKRIITAWKASRKSKEVEKLLNDCPHLRDELNTESSKS